LLEINKEGRKEGYIVQIGFFGKFSDLKKPKNKNI
jgi:hypothetical protein